MPGQQVPIVRTWPGDRRRWLDAWLDVFRASLRALNVLPEASIETVARNFVALAWSETGGTAEHNFNPANLTAFAWRGPWFELRSGMHFRSYPDVASGAADLVRSLTRGRYLVAWGVLILNPDDVGPWRLAMLEVGYATPPPGRDRQEWLRETVADIVSVRHRIERILSP